MKDNFIEYSYRIVKNCERYLSGEINKSEIFEMRFDEPLIIENSLGLKLQYAFVNNKNNFDLVAMNHIVSYIPNSTYCIKDQLPIHSHIFKIPRLLEYMYHGFIAYIFSQIERAKILWLKEKIENGDWIILFEDAFLQKYIDALTLYYYSLIYDELASSNIVFKRFAEYMDYRANRELVYKFVDVFERMKKITKVIIKKYDDMIQ
jgi:hypothetical protein